MKRIKKLFAVMIAVLLAVPFFGARVLAVDYDEMVSVTGLQNGDKVNFYKVVEWVGDAEGNVGGWKATSAYAEVLNETTLTLVLVGDPDADPAVEPTGITFDLARRLSGVTATAVAGPLSAADNKVELTVGDDDAGTTDLGPGIYMAVVTAVDPGYVYNPVFVSSDFNIADTSTTNTIDISSAKYGTESTAVAKKTPITLVKTTEDANSTVDQAIDSYVGQEVTFYVDTVVPVFLDSYKNPSFVIDDKIETDGIEFKANSVEVQLNGTAVDDAYAADEFTLEENGTKGYTVTFKEAYLKGMTVPVNVHIEYKGKITNTAEFNVNEDDNTVTVTYSNGPGTEKGALRDRTNHYTFSIGAKALGETSENGKTWELVKVAVDENGNPVVEQTNISEWNSGIERHPLEGAVFGLYSDSGCTTLYTNDLYPEGATFTTLADGIITFKGLDAGTFYLKEISAPTGYVKDTRTATIVIEATYETVNVDAVVENDIKVAGYETKVLKSYTVTVNGVSVYDSDADRYNEAQASVETEYTFNNDGPHITEINEEDTTVNDSDLLNTPGTELPSTGGIGTTLFYVFGGVLVFGAGILLVSRQRMMN